MYNIANKHQTHKNISRINKNKQNNYCKSIQEYQGFALTIYVVPRLMNTNDEQQSMGNLNTFVLLSWRSQMSQDSYK